jgi:crotonobetainyl-CoA:carnitine CoA-transferase CaiB-like acyl-CoA transferase
MATVTGRRKHAYSVWRKMERKADGVEQLSSNFVLRGVVREMTHGSGETVKVIANPVRLSETPPDYRMPPPLLGEHTDAVLGDRLGLSVAALAELRAKGVI